MLTCTTGTSMREGDTVRCLETGKVVSLHDTCETLSDPTLGRLLRTGTVISGHHDDLRIRCHVYKLARHKVADTELGADGENGILCDPKLLDDLFRMHTCALEVAKHLSRDMLC